LWIAIAVGGIFAVLYIVDFILYKQRVTQLNNHPSVYGPPSAPTQEFNRYQELSDSLTNADAEEINLVGEEQED